jgi:hypothetical protein
MVPVVTPNGSASRGWGPEALAQDGDEDQLGRVRAGGWPPTGSRVGGRLAGDVQGGVVLARLRGRTSELGDAAARSRATARAAASALVDHGDDEPTAEDGEAPFRRQE